jgi:hypothetical protein
MEFHGNFMKFQPVYWYVREVFITSWKVMKISFDRHGPLWHRDSTVTDRPRVIFSLLLRRFSPSFKMHSCHYWICRLTRTSAKGGSRVWRVLTMWRLIASCAIVPLTPEAHRRREVSPEKVIHAMEGRVGVGGGRSMGVSGRGVVPLSVLCRASSSGTSQDLKRRWMN